ncbi:MAG: XdhC/CoxI family protein [Pedosphaera sp.]|nr:XdhC/CoxI family protein [Pedosphaera sp.]
MTASIFHSLAEAARANEPVALGIITGVKGSSPQKLGAKALFYPDRKIKGTLGGGCLEAEAQRLALQSLRDGKPQTFELVLDHDFGWDDGLICGGKVLGVILPNAQTAGEKFWNGLAARDAEKSWGVKHDLTIQRFNDLAPSDSHSPAHPLTRSPAADWLFHETITPPCALWIAGSGHIAQAVAPLALQLDFAVTIFDDRPELANHEIFPRDVAIRTGNCGELCAAPFPTVPTFGLIVTRGHKHDALVLETWIHRPFQFLGMIGSARKARTIAEHFVKKKIATAEEVARVACPVGIKIRSQSVMEIAVDILAQYIDKRAETLGETQTSTAKRELVR